MDREEPDSKGFGAAEHPKTLKEGEHPIVADVFLSSHTVCGYHPTTIEDSDIFHIH